MRTEHYERLLAKAKTKRDAARAEADNEYAEAVSAIKRVRAMDEDEPPASDANETELPAPTQPPPVGGVATSHPPAPQHAPSPTEMVRATVSEIATDYTFRQVKALLERFFPEEPSVGDSVLSGILWRLEKQGEIALVEKGRGKRPSTYRNKSKMEEVA